MVISESLKLQLSAISFNTNQQKTFQGTLGTQDITSSDMEKGADARTLSAEIFENCGNFLIVEDYAPLFSEENLFLVEMFDETFNIWHIYSL